MVATRQMPALGIQAPNTISVKFKWVFSPTPVSQSETDQVQIPAAPPEILHRNIHRNLFSGAQRWTATLHGAVSRREPCPAIATSWGLAAMTRSPAGWWHGRGPGRAHRSRSSPAGLSKGSCNQNQREAIPLFTKCCACPAEQSGL